MSSVYVLHEVPQWYAPLDAALEDCGVPHEEWFLDAGTFDLSRPPPEGVFFNRLSATAHTRGHGLAVDYARGLLRWIEGHGRRVVNGSRALELAMSKIALLSALSAFGIRVPRTLAAVGRERIVEAARSLPAPFLVKPNRSGKGIGIRLFHDIDALSRYVDSNEFAASPDGITLLQEYVDSPDGFITRAEFVGGRFLYALRSTTDRGFNLCPADFCAPTESQRGSPGFAILPGFYHPILRAYERFLARHEVEVAAVEFVVGADGSIYTFDLNINTNYNAEAEAAVGVSGMRAIAAFLGTELDSVATPHTLHAARLPRRACA